MRDLIAWFARWRAETCQQLATETDNADEMKALQRRAGRWARIDLFFSGLSEEPGTTQARWPS